MMRAPFPLARRLARDRSGAVAIEFVLWSILFFIVILGGLDVGLGLLYTSRLGAAVEQGALVAYNQRDSTQLPRQTLTDYVKAAARLPGAAVTVDIRCNGGQQSCDVPTADRQCACVSGLPATYVPASCGATCGSGATAGYYVTIQARYPYQTVVVPRRWAGGTLDSAATVRLQ